MNLIRLNFALVTWLKNADLYIGSTFIQTKNVENIAALRIKLSIALRSQDFFDVLIACENIPIESKAF